MTGELPQVQGIQIASPILARGWPDSNQQSAQDLTLILKIIKNVIMILKTTWLAIPKSVCILS